MIPGSAVGRGDAVVGSLHTGADITLQPSSLVMNLEVLRERSNQLTWAACRSWSGSRRVGCMHGRPLFGQATR